MKKIILLPILVLIYSVSFSQLTFNTGNIEFDQNLGAINTKAKLDLKTFKLELSVSHNLPIPKIEELLKIMEPAEIILAKDIADIVKKPIDEVVSVYKVNKDKGWGYIAKQMGIKPGSPEFHALKGKTKNKGGKAKNKDKGGKGKGKGNGKGKGKK
jgi:hypothetical protein